MGEKRYWSFTQEGYKVSKGMNQKLSRKKMAYNHYLTIQVFLILTLIFNSCGSAKKVKINASRSHRQNPKNIKAKSLETQIKPLKSLQKTISSRAGGSLCKNLCRSGATGDENLQISPPV